MSLPRLIVTGASGFIGRRLVEALKEDYEIVGIARRSQSRSGATIHPNVTWFQVDIADRDSLSRTFAVIREAGGADVVIHLAAHYDFTGDNDPEYWRTNVRGLRNVLEECTRLDLRGFVFASSVAACSFPEAGQVLSEDSPPDGDHVYAVTKRMGEEMLAEYDGRIKSCIVRFAAMFSDWCEYAPLYFFLDTWLSDAWNSRVLGGRGRSAIPYMHLREIPAFFRQVLAHLDDLEQREVLIASPSSTIDHLRLFELANVNYRGRRRKPVFMPKTLAFIGVWARDLLGRALGNRPFERPWMMKYVDLDLAVDASRTYERLGWRPRERLMLPRRMPFLVEHLKRDPVEWHRRNREAMKKVHLRSNLRIHGLLEKHHDRIREQFVAALLDPEDVDRFAHYQEFVTGEPLGGEAVTAEADDGETAGAGDATAPAPSSSRR